MDTPRPREPFRIGRFSKSAILILMPACSLCSERRHRNVAGRTLFLFTRKHKQSAASSFGLSRASRLWRGVYKWKSLRA